MGVGVIVGVRVAVGGRGVLVLVAVGGVPVTVGVADAPVRLTSRKTAEIGPQLGNPS